nr:MULTISPECIES: FHA domain-containing protein [unclassified Fusibacter]
MINEEADSIGVSSEPLVDSPKFLQEDTTVLVCADSTVPYLLRLSTGEKHFISKPCLLIGRQKDVVDIHLSDSAIGRTHAEINFTGGACVIRDLFSKNGTFINEERVEVNKPVALAVGDQLKLADVELVYHEG